MSKNLGPDSPLSAVLDNAEARRLLSNALPGIIDSPMALSLRTVPIGLLVERDRTLAADPAARARLLAELATVEDRTPERPGEHPVDPDPGYEGPEVARGSAAASAPERVGVHERFELVLTGPAHGNPFVDVELDAEFTAPDGQLVRVGGCYDGGGRYLVRHLPPSAGAWSFRTRSTARSLDGITGTLEVVPSAARGPVRVDGLHFRYADGTRYTPVGTTAYAWTHQGEELERRTLATLAASPFTKVRMCVFPKSYLYNTNEPERFVFPRDADGRWDLTRFDPAYFAHLEQRLDELQALGIEADLILFHPYDRWGFADLGRAAADRYVRYLVRRLAAFPNVWWSMANEYDLLWSTSVEDWERMAGIVVEEDPVGHLRSIHNCLDHYDHGRPWITHCSVQRIDTYRTAEETDTWRARWGKPVVVDECGYEGDLDQGWGNLTGEEMTRRCWEGAVRGGYVAHGETYLTDDEVLWWSRGGELTGSSPARMAFLAQVVAESPTGVLDPLPSEWDAPWGGVADRYAIVYFGFNRPRFRTVTLPPGQRVHVDVLDTWQMTVDRLPGTFEGTFTVPLPARQYLALRLTTVDAGPEVDS